MKLVLSVLLVLAAASSMNAFSIPSFGNGDLHNDLKEFWDLVPTDKILEIAMEYISEDAEVQKCFEFIQSEQFKALVVEVENLPEIKNLMQYIQKTGFDIYALVNKLNEFLGTPILIPPQVLARFDNTQITGGVNGLINDILNVLPIEKLTKLYKEKLQSSKAFKDFIDQLKSKNFQDIVNKVYKHKTVQHIIKKLKELGVDLQKLKKLIYIVLGITIPEKSVYFKNDQLTNDLKEFINLLPLHDIEKAFRKHRNDPEIKKVIAFLHSKEFKELVNTVENIKEFQNFLIYLDASGLAIYEGINVLHKLIGLPDYVPPHPSNFDIQSTGGLKALIDEIKALIPRKEVKDLFDHKLKTSKEFAEFVKRLRSPGFQKIVDSLYANKTFTDMLKKAEAYGLNFKHVGELLTEIFGLTFPPRP